MIEALLIDSLARVANAFYKEGNKDNKELTKVLAIYFEKSDDTCDFKVKIKKFIFSQKGKSPRHKKCILDILNYCHGRSDRFITESNKLLIRNYMSDISLSIGTKSEVVESIVNNEDDQIILKNLFIDLSLFKECNQIEPKRQQKLHFLNILFFDYLILKTVFTKFFELDNGFNIEKHTFCALVHRFIPNVIDFDSLKVENKRDNLELAFKIAKYVKLWKNGFILKFLFKN